MKRLAMLFVATALLASTSGCYGLWPFYYGPYGGYGYNSSGYNSPGYSPNCPTGSGGLVPPAGTTIVPQSGALYSPYNATQAGIPTGAPLTLVPPTVAPAYPTTAVAPLESLPTY